MRSMQYYRQEATDVRKILQGSPISTVTSKTCGAISLIMAGPILRRAPRNPASMIMPMADHCVEALAPPTISSIILSSSAMHPRDTKLEHKEDE